jgi:hypothetical protein
MGFFPILEVIFQERSRENGAEMGTNEDEEWGIGTMKEKKWNILGGFWRNKCGGFG